MTSFRKPAALAITAVLALIGSVSLAAEGGWPALNAQVGASSYIVPETAAVGAGTAPAGTTAASGTTTPVTPPAAATTTTASPGSELR